MCCGIFSIPWSSGFCGWGWEKRLCRGRQAKGRWGSLLHSLWHRDFSFFFFVPQNSTKFFLKNRVPQIYDIKSCDVKKKKEIWPCNMDSFFVNFINFFLEKPSVSIIIFTTECKEKERDLVNNKKNDAAKEGLSGNCKEEEFNNNKYIWLPSCDASSTWWLVCSYRDKTTFLVEKTASSS